jgi:hypothetical protein
VNASIFPTTDGRLLARHKGKPTLIKQLRPYLSEAAAAVRFALLLGLLLIESLALYTLVIIFVKVV